MTLSCDILQEQKIFGALKKLYAETKYGVKDCFQMHIHLIVMDCKCLVFSASVSPFSFHIAVSHSPCELSYGIGRLSLTLHRKK